MNGFLAVSWNFDPTFFTIFGLDIRYYGLMWALAILIGALFFIQFGRLEGLPDKVADWIFVYGAIAAVLGARLGHCLFYDPGYYLANPLQILNFRDGGMASHGAAIGLLLGLWLFSRKMRLPYLWSLDRVMIPVAIGGALVRLGNLFNSEIYGRETDLPWGFIFERNGETAAMHPTQIYEALCYLLLFFILCWFYYRRDTGRRYPGFMFGVGLIGIFLPRFIIEYVKWPQVAFEEGMRLNMGQLLSIPFIIAGVVMIIYGLKHKQTPPPLADKSFFPKAAKATAPAAKSTAKKQDIPLPTPVNKNNAAKPEAPKTGTPAGAGRKPAAAKKGSKSK